MTTIPPTPAPILPSVLAAAAGPVVTIPQPPPQILNLPPGATIETVVVESARPPPTGDDARATVTLRTPEGEVSVRTAVPLDDGARVALEVLRTANNQVTARVVSIDDVPVKQALAQVTRDNVPPAELALPEKPAPVLSAPRAPVLQPGQAWTPMGPAPLPSIQPLSAYVLKVPSAPTPQPTTAPATSINSFLPGSDLGIRIISVQTAPTPPGAKPLSAPNTPTPTPIASTPAPTASAAAPSPVKTPGQSLPTTPAINRPVGVAAPVVAPSTPSQPAPSAQPKVSIQTTEPQGLKLATPQGLGPTTASPPKTVEPAPILTRLTGQVTGATNTGAAIVQTPAGEIQLNVRANLPVGSTVVLEVMTALPPRPDAPPLPAVTPGPLSLPLAAQATGWASMTEAIQILQRSDPQTAAQLTAALPDGGPKTAVATLAFMQAMRSGDARQWPGDSALRGLERSSPRGAQLAEQISGEVREMSARASEVQSEWRATPMPWNLDGKIDRINLITRREGTDEEGEDAQKKSGKGKGTRFLINLDLSNLGEMQLDGLFVKSTRAFDLMIRSKDPLPEDMRRDLSGLFANSNAALGLKGALTFQIVKKFPDPAASTPAPDRGGVWA